MDTSSTGVDTFRPRLLHWFCFATVVFLLSGALASFAAPPIRTYKWGSRFSTPANQYVFDSFDGIEAERMPYVLATAPGSTPKMAPHPGDNCDNNNRYTTQLTADTGDICVERRTSFACIIPGLDPPYWFSHCESVEAVQKCPDGFQWSGVQCAADDTPDPSKAPASCPVAGNPIHIGVGNKFERELDYAAPGTGGLRWERTYSSSDLSRWARLGELWRHSYSRSILVQTSGTAQMATLRRADGAIYRFVLDGGIWGSDADVNDRLTELTDGSGARGMCQWV